VLIYEKRLPIVARPNLLVFLHILTDNERIRDPEGQECADLETAWAEADRSARELMAQQLQAGAPPPLAWRIQIADAEDKILATVSFSAIAFGRDEVLTPLASLPNREIIHQVRGTIREGRERRAGIRASIAEAHQHLRTLARLNEALARKFN
jgi:hypothetical protein